MDGRSVTSQRGGSPSTAASKQTASVDITSALASLNTPASNGLAWEDPVFPSPSQSSPCPICDEEFYPGAVRQRLCTAACRRHAFLERMRAAKIGTAEACLRCGVLFTRQSREELPFCSSFCKWIFWKLTSAADSPLPSDEPTAEKPPGEASTDAATE